MKKGNEAGRWGHVTSSFRTRQQPTCIKPEAYSVYSDIIKLKWINDY